MSGPRDWNREFHNLDTDPAELPFGGDVAALWCARLRDGRLPSWSDFDISDFREWLGYVCRDDVLCRDPVDTVAKLWGTKMTQLTGGDWTGTTIRADAEKRGMNPGDYDFWDRVVNRPCIGLLSGTVDWLDRDFVTVRRIFLPLSGDGEMVDCVLSVTFPIYTSGRPINSAK